MTDGTPGHESEELSAILAALDQPVLLCRPDGTVMRFNDAARELAQEVWGEVRWSERRLDQSFGAREHVRLAECQLTAAAGRPAECEVTVPVSSGGSRTLLLRWRAVAPRPEAITGVCVTVIDVSARRAAERSLGLLRRALDAIAEGVVVADRDQETIFANKAFLRLAQADGAHPGTLASVVRGVGGEAASALRARLAAGQAYTGEIEGRTATGQLYWHAVAITPLLNSQGLPTHYVGVREDITAWKQLERSLAESSSRLEAVITTAMDGIISFDEEQRIVLINHAACAIFGLTETEALGRPIGQLIPVLWGATDPAAEVPHEPDANVGRLGELHGRRSNGAPFPLEVSVSQVQVQGRRIGTAILRDISARWESERVLQASQRRFKSIFEHSIDGIMLTDDTGTYVDANPAACTLLGYSQSELVALKLQEVAVLPEQPEWGTRWQELLQSGRAQGEFHLRRADGRLVLVEYSAIAHILPGLHLMLVRDVTERRALQEQLLRQQRLDSVGRLASGLAHDLNNILTPILMVPGMLRGRVQDPVSLNLLDVLEQGARRGAAIIEQLLTFARERPGERKQQHLGTLAEAAGRIVRETFPRNIEFELRVDHQPWPFMGDATQLQQLILNLAMNAKDAMQAGGRLTIAVTNEHVSPEEARATPGAKPGPHVVLSVVDTGDGIEPEHLGRIFDPFFTTKPLGEGTGLGLSAALGIVRHHGGVITVRSRPRHGATFRVFFPAVGVEAPPPAESPVTVRPTGSGEVVLVVDDEEHLRSLARQWLSQHGYAVICARDGENALAQLKAADHQVDLVLTDLAMPGMGGDRLIQLLRRRNPELRIIVMTGHDASGAVQSGRVPVHGYLRKPFTGEDLLHALAAVRARPDDRAGAGPGA